MEDRRQKAVLGPHPHRHRLVMQAGAVDSNKISAGQRPERLDRERRQTLAESYRITNGKFRRETRDTKTFQKQVQGQGMCQWAENQHKLLATFTVVVCQLTLTVLRG